MLVSLIGGPRHGERFDLEGVRDVVQMPYRVAAGSDPLDDELSIGTYRAEKFIDWRQLSRDEMFWRMWKVYLWQDLPADESTTTEYFGYIVNELLPDDHGRRPATAAEQARWDDEHASRLP